MLASKIAVDCRPSCDGYGKCVDWVRAFFECQFALRVSRMEQVEELDTETPAKPPPLVGEVIFTNVRQDEASRLRTQQVIRALSQLMDTAFEVPGLGWRFGLDPIIGLFPVVGDFASAAVSLYILAAA